MASITFLFGAGADSLFELADGGNFATSVIGADSAKYEKSIVEYYKGLNVEWYPPFNLSYWKMEDLLKASIRKQLLTEEVFKTQKQYASAVNMRFEKLKNQKKKAGKQIHAYTSYMGILDEHFHTLINPIVLGPKKFWRVVMCYARAYCCLTAKMLPLDQKNKYELLLEKPKKVLDWMKKYANDLNSQKPNYYNAVKEIKEQHTGFEFHVISSNYTTLCQSIIGLNDKDIAYIHGRIGWFESARDLKVYDVANEDIPSGDVVFPYLFIQSGVKPIVDTRQITEYTKMIQFLNEAESTLIIVGYCLNADDNHLNSIIRSYLLDGNHVIYFSYKEKYNDESEKEKRVDILKRLRITENNLEKPINFTLRHIDRETSINDFKATVLGVLEGPINA